MNSILKTCITVALGVAALYFYRYIKGPHVFKEEGMIQNTFRGKYIKQDGIEIWTESFGNHKDPAIVLISGAMGSARGWTDQFCSYLALKGFFVIRFDNRDTGLSSSIDYEKNPYTLDDMVQDIVAILDAYDIKKCHLVGHSVGGTLAQVFAVKHPEKTETITMIGSKSLENPELREDDKKILEKTWETFLSHKPTLNYDESVEGFLRAYRRLSGTLPFDEELAREDLKDSMNVQNICI